MSLSLRENYPTLLISHTMMLTKYARGCGGSRYSFIPFGAALLWENHIGLVPGF